MAKAEARTTSQTWKLTQKEGQTIEGFPQDSEFILPRFLLYPGYGLVGKFLIPINQDGMRPGEVRVIIRNAKTSPNPQES